MSFRKVFLRAVALIFVALCVLISVGAIKLPKTGLDDPRLEGYTGMLADGPGPNGSVYSGEMKDGLADGDGVLVYEDGSRYEGHFNKGYFDGQGVYSSAAGWSYDGSWKKGAPDGEGIYKSADGRVYEGVFDEGIAV